MNRELSEGDVTDIVTLLNCHYKAIRNDGTLTDRVEEIVALKSDEITFCLGGQFVVVKPIKRRKLNGAVRVLNTNCALLKQGIMNARRE